MKRFLLCLAAVAVLALNPLAGHAQPDPAPASSSSSGDNSSATKSDADKTSELKTDAAAALAAKAAAPVRTPDFLEHLVDEILAIFNVRNSGNTPTHWAIFMLFLVGGLLLRRVVTGIIFHYLKKLAARTETTLDDKLFPALEAPVATFVMLIGIFSAFKVLKLSVTSDQALSYGSTVAFSLVLFWGLLRAFNALLDHAHEVARDKGLGIAAFMPWIKKTLVVAFVVVGVLLTAQTLGADVKAFLAGLGIGGLAFALAAQDTIANVFGSIVVAIDQPFKIGEAIKISGQIGIVEDIGLRSTKIRMLDRSLAIFPNKTVAAESIVNLSRFTARRVDLTLGLTYDTKPEQMEAVIEDIRALLSKEPEIDPGSIVVTFSGFSASSLDIFIVYMTLGPDFQAMLRLKQRMNLAFMRAVAARGLEFAFPTQTVHVVNSGDVPPAGAIRPASNQSSV